MPVHNIICMLNAQPSITAADLREYEKLETIYDDTHGQSAGLIDEMVKEEVKEEESIGIFEPRVPVNVKKAVESIQSRLTKDDANDDPKYSSPSRSSPFHKDNSHRSKQPLPQEQLFR